MTYDIYINSAIGWPFSAGYVREELAKCGKKTCNVYISSLGGAVIDALQIRQMFLEHGDVCVHLHGFVASAATIIAMGAKRIVMGQYALFLMHRCSNWVDTWGQMNAEEIDSAIRELEASRNALETIDRTVANIYAARCGKGVKDVAEWMQEAEWLTAEECKERGLADEICRDTEKPVVTDAMRGEILACGFPLPACGRERAADISRRSLLDGLKALFSPSASAQTDDGKNFQNMDNMDNKANTDYKSVMAVLESDGLTATDGGVLLSAGQLTALDRHLSSLAAEKDALAAQVAELSTQKEELAAQVTALQKADGDSTARLESVTGEDAGNYAARAREAYSKLQHLG